jgi:pimeloyl-ACP methyl ester carboxylesterase
METRTFTSDDGTRIVWYSGGNPDGDPIVLSNGLGGNIDVWELFVDYFGDRFRIVTWDYRGLYGSGPAADPDHYTIPHHLADLHQLLDEADVKDPILVGWSMGVQLNFELCREHPDLARALIAINGTSGRPFSTICGTNLFEPGVPPILQIIREHWEKARFLGPLAIESPWFLKSLQTLGLAGATLDKEIFLKVARSFVQLDMGIYSRILEGLGEHDASDVLETLPIPVLVIAGQRDAMTPTSASEHMVAQIPTAELCVVPASTHYCPIEFPELVHLRIDKFLQDHLKLS